MKLNQLLLFFGILALFTACQSDEDLSTEILDVPDVNELPNPNDAGASMVELGRMLFWDPILSGGKEISCATCHHPSFGYADGRALSIGVNGVGLGPQRRHLSGEELGFVKRNSPTILNTAFNGMNENGNFNSATAPMFWDNRTRSLELQALGPIESFEEMRGHAFSEEVALDSIVNRLRNNANYRNLFNTIFGNDHLIEADDIGTAIAAFERTILATNSPFDEFQAGNENAMTQQQLRGMDRFMQVGCDDCHSGPMFSDFELHVLGVPDHDLLETSDAGANGTYAFRTPTLRNLPATGPYFHNGVARTLEETVRFYITARNFANNNNNQGGGQGLNVNPNINRNDIDNDVRDLNNLNNNAIDDIVAFLEALNDTDFDRTIPTSVPSGLEVGGFVD